MKEANPEASVSDIAKLLGAQWNELSEEEKQPYEEKAAADKERYAQEVERLLPLIQAQITCRTLLALRYASYD